MPTGKYTAKNGVRAFIGLLGKKRTANAQQTHSKRTANAQQTHTKCLLFAA
jgi:hypothetical protein